MKHILEVIYKINKTMETIDFIDEMYFGNIDNSHSRKFKDGQLGYYKIESGPYNDDFTFHPYDDQEKMKAIFNVLKILRRDFSERCLELNKKAVDKLEYSLNNDLKIEE